MTTVYIPRPIRTVEDAEKLPEGTIAYQDRKKKAREVAVKVLDAWGDMPPMWAVNGLYRGCADVVGWTALVPVEAEEEHEEAGGISIAHGSTLHWPARTRLATPWEAMEEA